jgi:hypothetical protein
MMQNQDGYGSTIAVALALVILGPSIACLGVREREGSAAPAEAGSSYSLGGASRR